MGTHLFGSPCMYQIMQKNLMMPTISKTETLIKRWTAGQLGPKRPPHKPVSLVDLADLRTLDIVSSGALTAELISQCIATSWTWFNLVTATTDTRFWSAELLRFPSRNTLAPRDLEVTLAVVGARRRCFVAFSVDGALRVLFC